MTPREESLLGYRVREVFKNTTAKWLNALPFSGERLGLKHTGLKHCGIKHCGIKHGGIKHRSPP